MLIRKSLFILSLGVILSGCGIDPGSNQTALESSIKMSQPIFLPPFLGDTKQVYIEAQDATGQDVRILSLLQQNLQAKGFTITQDSKDADAILEANILQAGKMSSSNLQSALTEGFGGPLFGSGNAQSGATSVPSVYSMIMDVQIYAKVPDGIMTIQTSTAHPGMQIYQTRIVSSDQDPSLNFNMAKPLLQTSLANEVSSIFKE